MPTQTLVLYLDATHASGIDKGEFSTDDPKGQRSKVWVDEKGDAIPDGKILSVPFASHVDINVTVTANPPKGNVISSLRITVVLWRTHIEANKARHDSPFVDETKKQKTVFDEKFAAGHGTVRLGIPTLNSGVKGHHNRYMLLIAAMADAVDAEGKVTTLTAGHDPQMDVDL